MKKSLASHLALIGLAYASSGNELGSDYGLENKKGGDSGFSPIKEKLRRKKVNDSYERIIQKRGAEKFYYTDKDGNDVYLFARNRKNADKKAKKKGWIK